MQAAQEGFSAVSKISSIFGVLGVIALGVALVSLRLARQKADLLREGKASSEPLVATLLEHLNLDLSDLTKAQRFELAAETLRERRRRLVVYCLLASVAMALAAASFVWSPRVDDPEGQHTSPPSTSGGSSSTKESSGLTQVSGNQQKDLAPPGDKTASAEPVESGAVRPVAPQSKPQQEAPALSPASPADCQQALAMLRSLLPDRKPGETDNPIPSYEIGAVQASFRGTYQKYHNPKYDYRPCAKVALFP